ncbi:unnamed protein product [Orchesella dallaii]|uniref:C-type lectin domain-containing protein n=1 Tax=Orchesella dallaii TaxID=48710 RepID=A0ABP1Q8F2_9HEXA
MANVVFRIFLIIIVTLTQAGRLNGHPSATNILRRTRNYPSCNSISRNNAQWRHSERDCKNLGFLGLAEIKDRQEFDQIDELLRENANTASTYWVGAKYVPSARKFKWTATKEFVGDWLEDVWEDGYPGTILSAQTALQLKFTRDLGP